MKKPENARGIGVRFSEIQEAIKLRYDPEYILFLLKMAVEKLKCIKSKSCLNDPVSDEVIKEILNREEWIENQDLAVKS